MSVPPSASVSSSTTIKRSHSDIGSDDDVEAVPSSIKRFASRIVDVYVGDERFHYPTHEAFLFQSKELKSQYDVQNRGKKNNKKKENILNLPRDTPSEFGQLLEYLYLNKFTLRASEPQAQAEELLGIWTAGTRHSLIGMQKHVIRKLEELDIAGKLPVLAFLRLADKLYESEVDNGLRRYFSTVATGVVSKITAADMPVLLEMIIEGGSFASDLFHAHHKAFGPGKSAAATEQGSTIATAAIKTEESQPQRTAKRARTENIADVRTEWDIANSIPVALEAATVEDKLLVRWADDRKPWCDIALAWENHTSEKISIKDLKRRYERIDANILRLGNRDSDLLHLARTAIETAFKTSKWPLIAARIVEDGGTRIPHLQLQRYCDALDAKAAEQEATRHANEVAAAAAATTAAAAAGGKGSQIQPLRPHHHLAARRLPLTEEAHVPTEVVGGVRVENSKPLDVVRRKRWVPGPKNAPVANTAKKSGASSKTKGKADATTTNTANTANGGGTTPEVEDSGDTDMDDEEGFLFFEDDNNAPLDTGVRVSGERGPREKGKGNMRRDYCVVDAATGTGGSDHGMARGVVVVEEVVGGGGAGKEVRGGGGGEEVRGGGAGEEVRGGGAGKEGGFGGEKEDSGEYGMVDDEDEEEL